MCPEAPDPRGQEARKKWLQDVCMRSRQPAGGRGGGGRTEPFGAGREGPEQPSRDRWEGAFSLCPRGQNRRSWPAPPLEAVLKTNRGVDKSLHMVWFQSAGSTCRGLT